MVEIPKYYYKIVDTNEYRDYLISEKKFDKTWLCSPRHSGYEGHPEERDVIYVGAYSTSANGSAGRKISSTSNVNRTALTQQTIGQARNKNTSLGTNFYMYDYSTFWTIALLYIIEVANWNSQGIIGSGYTSSTNTSSCYIGLTDGWIYDGYHTGAQKLNNTSVKYRGIENLWGNLNTWVDGIKFYNADIYISLDPTKYINDPRGENSGFFKLNYTRPNTAGFIKNLGYDINNPWAQFSVQNAGTPSTFIPDNCTAYSNDVVNVMAMGGQYNMNERPGLFACTVNSSTSTKTDAIGSRCIYLP